MEFTSLSEVFYLFGRERCCVYVDYLKSFTSDTTAKTHPLNCTQTIRGTQLIQ